MRIDDSSARKEIIDSLNSCTEYDITISIENKDNEGPKSDVVTAITGKLLQ